MNVSTTTTRPCTKIGLECHDQGCRKRWQNWSKKSWLNVIEGGNVYGIAQTWHGGGDLR